MNCAILSMLYLRANGEIPCYDDAGSKVSLGHAVDRDGLVDIDAILGGQPYQHIRRSMRKQEMPWGNVCASCALIRPNEAYADLLSERRIQTLQIEPTLACALACPGCTRTADVRERAKPLRLSVDRFEAVLRGLREQGYSVGEIEYCGNGEPLNHPKLREFVLLARKYYPGSLQRLITNGNFDYARTIGDARLDQIFISCDGARQNSYEKYRVNGRIEDVFKFMSDIPAELGGCRQIRTWKYILFEHNDSDEEIIEAQAKAVALGVDALMFVFTHSEHRSVRYTRANAHQVPRCIPNVMLDATPIHKIADTSFQSVGPSGPHEGRFGRWIAMIDSLSAVDAAGLCLRGWALARSKITSIRVLHDGIFVGWAQLGEIRLDVLRACPRFDERFGGFSLTWRTAAPAPQHCIEIELLSGDRIVGRHARTFVVSPESMQSSAAPMPRTSMQAIEGRRAIGWRWRR